MRGLFMISRNWKDMSGPVGCSLKATLLGLLVIAASVTHAQDIPNGFSVSAMNRATIFVRDLDKSLQLYRDLLGLKIRVEALTEGERINQIMGTEGLALRAVILQSGDSIVGNIGIYEIIGDDRSTLPPPSDRNDTVTGDVAVVFATNDMDAITEQVRAAGYTLISPPMVLYPREDAEVQTREMLFRDRDGVLVNLIEFGVPRPEWSRPSREK